MHADTARLVSGAPAATAGTDHVVTAQRAGHAAAQQAANVNAGPARLSNRQAAGRRWRRQRRGAWAGPVVAACAVLDHATAKKWRHVLVEVKDSKQLKPEKRDALAQELKMILPAWSVAEMDAIAIDRENILEATMMAMRP